MRRSKNYYKEQLNRCDIMLEYIDIAYHIYSEMIKEIQHSSNEPTVSSVFNALVDIYNRSGYYPSIYLNECAKEICYDMVLDAYWTIRCANDNNNEQKEINLALSSDYLNAIYSGATGVISAKSKAQDLSRKKSAYLKEIVEDHNSKYKTFNDGIFELRSSQKYIQYTSILSSALSHGDFKPVEMSELDSFFYVVNHFRTYNNLAKATSKKTYNDMYELLSDYKKVLDLHIDEQMHTESMAFEKEISVFVMEKMLHGITYSQAFISYLKHCEITEDTDIKPCLIDIYCKLHDCPHISLIDFTINHHNITLPKFFDDTFGEDLRLTAYADFEMHNSFILPMLKLIFLKAITEIFNDNAMLVLTDYIYRELNATHSYFQRFNNLMENIERFRDELNSNKTHSNKLKELVLSSRSRKKIVEELNHCFYRSFYLNDVPNGCLNVLGYFLLSRSSPDTFFSDYKELKKQRRILSPKNVLQQIVENYYMIHEQCKK